MTSKYWNEGSEDADFDLSRNQIKNNKDLTEKLSSSKSLGNSK